MNCTLKYAPEISNTEALMLKVKGWWDGMDVETEIVHRLSSALRRQLRRGRRRWWPRILEKVKAADIICIGTPIWFGVRGSVAQMVIERLDGTYERNEVGQYPLYNKVGCVVVTGNEDGAHAAAETTLFNLSHLGCAIRRTRTRTGSATRGPDRATSKPAASITRTRSARPAGWPTTPCTSRAS